MKVMLIAGLAAAAVFTLAEALMAADAHVVSIELPEDHDSYRPGPNVEDAQGYCAACHAADYVYMQPPLSREQWQGEVVKMKNVFHCPMPDDKVDAIVEYLMSQNGKTN